MSIKYYYCFQPGAILIDKSQVTNEIHSLKENACAVSFLIGPSIPILSVLLLSRHGIYLCSVVYILGLCTKVYLEFLLFGTGV